MCIYVLTNFFFSARQFVISVCTFNCEHTYCLRGILIRVVFGIDAPISSKHGLEHSITTDNAMLCHVNE